MFDDDVAGSDLIRAGLGMKGDRRAHDDGDPEGGSEHPRILCFRSPGSLASATATATETETQTELQLPTKLPTGQLANCQLPRHDPCSTPSLEGVAWHE